jgi:hypothetical protein
MSIIVELMFEDSSYGIISTTMRISLFHLKSFKIKSIETSCLSVFITTGTRKASICIVFVLIDLYSVMR